MHMTIEVVPILDPDVTIGPSPRRTHSLPLVLVAAGHNERKAIARGLLGHGVAGDGSGPASLEIDVHQNVRVDLLGSASAIGVRHIGSLVLLAYLLAGREKRLVRECRLRRWHRPRVRPPLRSCHPPGDSPFDRSVVRSRAARSAAPRRRVRPRHCYPSNLQSFRTTGEVETAGSATDGEEVPPVRHPGVRRREVGRRSRALDAEDRRIRRKR